MSGYIDVIKKTTNPNIAVIRDDIARRKDKDFFWPTGTQVYCGRQGSGKTLSAVKHMLDLKKRYPKSVIVTNLALAYFRPRNIQEFPSVERAITQGQLNPTREYITFSSAEELADVLTRVNNGFKGVIYLIDEIHTYFNALDSKNIPSYVFTEISQQRKQRKLIIGTSQLFLRMAKPLREQCDNLIMCNTVLGIFTRQRAYDGMDLTQDYDGSLTGNLKKSGWFFHNREVRNAFDTYQKVVSSSQQLDFENTQPMRIEEKPKNF